MNLNAARRLRRCVSGFSLAGWRTWRESNPLINRYSIFTTKRRDFSRIMSFDSFPDYRSANQAEGGQTPSADVKSAGFGVAQTPTVYFRERLLLLALKGSGRFAATGSGLLCGFCQLSLLVLVRSTVPGRLKGFPVVGVSVGHEGFTPSPPKYRR